MRKVNSNTMSLSEEDENITRSELIKDMKKELKIKDTKPVVNPPSLIDKIFHRTNQKRSVYYFTSGRKVNPEVLRELAEEKPQFTLPKITGTSYKEARRLERQKQREEESKLRVEDKPSRRSRFAENLAERLYVPPDETFKKKRVKQNLDPHYYDVVKKRPIKEQFKIEKFILDVRQSLLTQLKTGYLQDEIVFIDERFNNEKKRINRINNEYKEYYSSFKDFEAQDREQWLMVRKLGEEMAGKTNEKKTELKELMKELSLLRCSLYVLEENWRNCKLCQIFLYQISPKSWQERHPLVTNPEFASNFDFSKMFERYKLNADDSVMSLNSLIQIFQEDAVDDMGEPELYFTEPWQVSLVFREMELQHLSTLLMLEGVRKPKDDMTHGLQVVMKYYDDEIASIKEQLTSIESSILLEWEQARRYELLAKELVHTNLKNLITSESTTLLKVYVEHAYESCMSTGQVDMTSLETLEKLKVLFEDLMMKLNSLPVDIVRQAENTVTKKTNMSMERALQAQKRVAHLEVLMKSMKRALEPPYVKSGRPLIFRSAKPPAKPKRIAPPKGLSEKELEYLTYFTDYCEHADENVQLFLPLGD
uniref:DUF4200 domain-containing protein n=2 Tax=Clastoptera arizonana TaxID=38151 RepID=A0A1B6C853_9HEMI